MLITIGARLVRPYGTAEAALPQGGRIEYRPETHGVWEGALRGRETVTAKILDGVAEEVELTPGVWKVRVIPDHGTAWDSWLVELEAGMPEPVDLVDLAPVLVVDGEKWTVGPAGASVVGGRDNGDGTVSFELSDGTYTDPVTLPPGPAGRGIASISDPDTDSRVTITFTDGATATVQAIRGADGRTPAITWEGTSIVVDGEQGPDLKGEPGADSTVPGPANSLTIGSVTTGATGTPASASITGTAPEQTLNLTLPRGEQGIPGTATLPDTGWRDVTALLAPAPTAGRLLTRRVGVDVKYRIEGLRGDAHMLYPEPPGFAAETSGGGWQGALCYVTDSEGTPPSSATAGSAAVNRFTSTPRVRFIAPTPIWGRGSVTTSHAFPTTLPGTPIP